MVNKSNFEQLKAIIKKLRDPKKGCPWDLEQTHQSLCQYAIEETYELVEAIEASDNKSMKEELGDVLLQVLLHSEIADQNKAFDIEDVIQSISDKMVRRHPHVFSNTQVKDSKEVLNNWEKIKKEENKTRPLFDFPKNLPALSYSNKLGAKSKKMGFDWPNYEAVWQKVREEIQEVEEAKSSDELEEEIGDLLFSIAQAARHAKIDPEQALRKGNQKFQKRFLAMQKICSEEGLEWQELKPQEKETFWQKAKQLLS